jgi:hypothetical protein
LAVLAQLALFAVATAPGLAGTADSGYYVHAASTLRAVGRLFHPDGSPYRYWPPLYPVLVSASGSLETLRLLHGLALVGSLLAWSWLGRRLLPGALAVLLPWVLALSTPWLVVSKFVWGETVFLALFGGYAGALFQFLHTRRWQWWAWATALGFLLPLHRTAGFFLLAGIGVGLLVELKRLLPKQRLQLVAHLGLSVLGGLVWHYYSLLVAAPSVYRLNKGWSQFFGSCADYGFVLSRWLLPVPAALRPVLQGLWALALVGVLGVLWPRPMRLAPMAPGSKEPPADGVPWRQRYLNVLWVTGVFFIFMLIVSTTFTRSAAGLYDSERYASVLFAPVVLLALWQLGLVTMSPAPKRLRLVAFGAVALLLAYSAGRASSNALALRKLPAFTWPALRRQ